MANFKDDNPKDNNYKNNILLEDSFLDKENPILLDLAPNSTSKQNNINKFCFDGLYYYFIVTNSNKVIQADTSLNILNIFNYEHILTSICYDTNNKCFWASLKNINNKLISFNFNIITKNLDILETLYLNPSLDSLNYINNINFNCCNDSLVIAYERHIIELEKNGNDYKKIYYTSNGSIIDVLSISPNYLVLVDTQDLYTSSLNSYNKIYQKIYVLDKNGKIFDYLDISNYIYVNSLVFNPCSTDILGVFIDYLVSDSNNLQYMCSKNIIFSKFEYKSCECNYTVCDANSDNNKPNPNPKPKPPKPDACDEILESIALVEASIACVLNAESLKLKKILECSDDLDLILKTNKQINKTIISLTNLEQLLYNKLVAVLEICEICEHHKNKK